MGGQRRTKGDGGITQRHDHSSCPPAVDGVRPKHRCRGRWQATLKVEVDGRPARKTLYAHTKEGARQKLAKAIADRDAGALVLKTVTVESWLTTWLDRKSRPPKPLKPQTMRSYRSKARCYLVPHLGRHRLTDLRAEHIEAMYDAMRGEGLAEATLRQTHMILAGAMKDAVRADKLAYNPILKTTPPGTDKAEREQFTVEQAKHVLRTAGSDARWWLALFYGMRQGEVLGLDWQWVNLDERIMFIEETLQTDEDGRLFLGKPKTESSQRPMPLVGQIESRLRLLWEESGRPDRGLVFTRDQKPLQPKRDWLDWRALIDRATVPPFAPLPYIALHAARNSAASLMEDAGIPDRLVMQILGQTQVQTTHRYQKADIERMRAALESAGQLLELD